MNFVEYFYGFKRILLSHLDAEMDLKDIISDTDLSKENQIEEIVVLLEHLESHHGLDVPTADSDLKDFARYIYEQYI